MALPELTLATLLVVPISLIAFLVLLSIIVFVHEYGHFKVARLAGVRVDVFSIGFGKPLARWRDRKGTEWRIAMIPLGGYVKFFGDANAASQPRKEVAGGEAQTGMTQFPRPGEGDSGGMTAEERRACFHLKPVWTRAAIVAAGPFANFILAIAIFWLLLFSFGSMEAEPRIGAVSPGSAAEEAGFQPGDLIVAVDGRRLTRFSDLSMRVKLSAGERIRFTVQRGEETIEIFATPRREEMQDAYGNRVRGGMLGVQGAPDAVWHVEYGPIEALKEATNTFFKVLGGTLRFLSRLILGKEDATQLGGPVKIAQYAGQAAMSGFDSSAYQEPPGIVTQLKVSLAGYIYLAALISLSIGFLNLLPIPVLDGGHLMYYAYEAVAGRPLGARAQAIGFAVGIVLLASLMIFVTWNDINNLLSTAS
jgi:regulator of sigma E protease